MENSWRNKQFSSSTPQHTLQADSWIFFLPHSLSLSLAWFCWFFFSLRYLFNRKFFGVASDVTQHDLSKTFRGKIFRKKKWYKSNNEKKNKYRIFFPQTKREKKSYWKWWIARIHSITYIQTGKKRNPQWKQGNGSVRIDSAHSMNKYDKNENEGGWHVTARRIISRN